MQYFKNFDLSTRHTLAAKVKANIFFICEKADELPQILKRTDNSKPLLVIGSGSNILFQNDFEGTVIQMQNKGIKIKSENKHTVTIEAQAGELWDDFVNFAVTKKYYGIENLSYIPGTVGAAPVQNIGAYGSEVKDTICKVYTFDKETNKNKVFSKEECQFEYRNSFFKKEGKDRYIITKVEFILKKQAKLNLSYGNLTKEIQKFKNPSLYELRQTIINIRQSKLPEPQDIPNAGSFFKNPIISFEKWQKLYAQTPCLVSYPVENNKIKLAAGQLIDLAGFKGYTDGKVGVHNKQALVLINHSGGTGKDIVKLAKEIQKKIYNMFEVNLEPEVLIL